MPELPPSFQLDPQAPVFHLGSCFARGLEGALARRGVRVTSRPDRADPSDVEKAHRLGFLDVATPPELLQELEWASGRRQISERSFLALTDLWIDPHLGERAGAGSLEAQRKRRAAIGRYFARAFQAKLVVVTFGETEIWFDRKTGFALAGPPPARLRSLDPDRFGLRRLGYDDVYGYLKSLTALLRGENGARKVILTVSPVPIERTFGGEDVIVANTIAKSTLVTAAAAIASAETDVDYFPVFEAVTTSDPQRAWLQDRRHVSKELVTAVIDAFVERYGLFLVPDSRTSGSA
ncbi:MAG: GSCFA domain-containing protein [Paracoccaceae bacterium]